MTPSDRPQRLKLTTLFMLPLLAVAGMLALFLPMRLDAQARRATEQRARGVARVMTEAIAPGVEFDDNDNVRIFLQRLSNGMDLTYAAVYRADGSILASWGDAPAAGPLPSAPEGVAVTMDAHVLAVDAPVQAAGGTRGRLVFGLSISSLQAEHRANVIVSVVAAAIVVTIGLLFSVIVGHVLVRRRRAEAALGRSEAGFRTLIESTPDAVTVLRGGLVVYTNPAAMCFLGDDRPEELLAMTEAGRRELTFVRPDGSTAIADVLTVPLLFEGQPSVVAISRDLTTKRQMEAQLLLADRMATVGTLAAGVAHELNNPLAYVIGNIDYVKGEVERLELPPACKQDLLAALEEAADGGSHCRKIVRDLTTFSRGGEEQPAVFDVRAALDVAINMARPELKNRVEVVKRYREVAGVMGNELRLAQVFLNLLVNAAQAMPKRASEENTIEAVVSSEGDRVVVEVRDNGKGIALRDLPRIFDPFFTTKPSGVGTGLGLAICHGIVTKMQGEITVSSEPGRGTTFRVSLPIPKAASMTPETGAPGRQQELACDRAS